MELYKKYRPPNLKDVIGQDNAIKVLEKHIEKNTIPHALLLSGPSGVGKTTFARCLRKPLKCRPRHFNELNIADIRGIDNIRDIRQSTMSYPLEGKTKIWLLDEVSELTTSAQKALLKMLEDTPTHIYFMLATTNPQKLIKPIRTRCTEIALKPISKENLEQLIENIILEENLKKSIPQTVTDKIIDCSDGSARQALVFLDAIIDLDKEKDMLETIRTGEEQAIELCRLLLRRASWTSIAKMLKELKGQEAENLRRMMLGYMQTCLLSGSKISPRAYYIMTCFEHNFFNTSHAGLAMACWESISGK